MGIPSVTYIIAAPLGGWLGEKMGYRPILFLGKSLLPTHPPKPLPTATVCFFFSILLTHPPTHPPTFSPS